MTRIDFYHYAEDKLRYACRLAATVAERDNRLVVFAPDEGLLASFDRLLWTYQSTRFVPHCRATDAIAAETPVVLASGDESLPHHDVLLNLGTEWPPFFASFERLLEIVGNDEEDKAHARNRFVFYRKRGYEINVNAIKEA
ncbi:MAG: DNA polymerase III subunit chi [Betaproteobacteria bacterium]|nr:DNA polymerase III subunit chi [Betaproteobacteria bacterium]PWB64754.1 MAG: DNA polymerase III subunit chi [Betaproteobacteria bacterium]